MLQNGLQELSGTPREASRGPLGRSWVTLGELLGRPRALFRALGALSGHSWSDLGAIMRALENSCTILESLGRFWTLRQAILNIRSSI